MPVIMHPVGRGGYNRREDVICIQTALANAKISGHGSFWTGKIDGKMSPDMMDAITLCQRAVRTPAVGRVGKNCPTCQSLEKVLPAAFKGMVAERSNAAHHKPKPASGAGHSSQAPRRRLKAALIRDQFLKNLVLPLALRNELTAFRGAVDRDLDLYLSYTSVKTDPAGYLRFELDIEPEPSTMDMVDIRRMIHTFRGIRAIPGSLLVLTTAQPIRFRPGSLRPGGAMHHMLTGKVNKNSGPVHDVAAIQAALANIKRPGGGAPFWTNSIDGKASVLLHKTFNEFQIAADIKPTGGLHRGEETEKALIAALPQELKRMRGVEGLPVAFVSGAGNPPTVPFTRLPDDMREAIKPVAKAVENTLGLPLVLREPPQDKVAHIAVRIGVGNGVFLDGQGRTMPLDRAPEAVKLVIEKALQADPRLNLDSNAAPGRLVLTMQADGKLMLESHQKAIEGPQYPTLAELGTTCALVGRPLDASLVDKFAGHLFIVAGAMFSGDPSATVYSFGQTATELTRPKHSAEDFLGIVPRDPTENMMGQVGLESGKYRGGDFSRNTHAEDVIFWEKLSVRPGTL